MGEESLDDNVFCTTAPQQGGVVRAQVKHSLAFNNTGIYMCVHLYR